MLEDSLQGEALLSWPLMANDHYVPQFYLRNFSPPTTPGRIYSYRRNLRPALVGIRSVASEENYYTMKSNLVGVQKDQVDRLFRDIESGAAPIIDYFLTSPNTRLQPNEASYQCSSPSWRFVLHGRART